MGWTAAIMAISAAAAAAQSEAARKQASQAAAAQKKRLAELDAQAKVIGPPQKQDTASAQKFARKTGRAGTVRTGVSPRGGPKRLRRFGLYSPTCLGGCRRGKSNRGNRKLRPLGRSSSLYGIKES